jgi:polysaccharide export outer membrane protein
MTALLGWSSLVSGQSKADQKSAIELQAGDVVKVEVWREEDLSGEFIIDERGMLTVPMIGELQAAGVPFDSLRERMMSAYRVMLRNPAITITPLRRIFVFGEVNKPGLYNVDPTFTIAGVIAMAEGVTPQGTLQHLRIVREGTELLQGVAANVDLESQNIQSGDQLIIGQRGWFARNSTFVVSVLLSATSIAISLLR